MSPPRMTCRRDVPVMPTPDPGTEWCSCLPEEPCALMQMDRYRGREFRAEYQQTPFTPAAVGDTVYVKVSAADEEPAELLAYEDGGACVRLINRGRDAERFVTKWRLA